MVLELRQQLKLAQKLVMTPQLRQAIKLLQLNRMELTDALQAEIEQNPLLEEALDVEEKVQNPEALSAEEVKEVPESVVTEQVAGDNPATVAEINWEDYANNFDTADFSFARETPPADAPSQFDFISAKPGLEAHLQWQLTHLDLTEKDMEIAQFIIGSLNHHGFLEADIEDICRYAHCDEETAQGVLNLIQHLDPPGVAARDIRESLLLQLEYEDYEEDDLPCVIVRDHLNLLQTRNYSVLARKVGQPVRKVEAAVKVITRLTPYPGNEFANDQTNYVVPDVYVYKIDDEFVIQLNDEGLPHLQLSAEYQKLLAEKKALNAESRGYLREKKRNAEWFIKSIQQRQRTIYKVMESLLRFQRDFFEKGPGHLKPLILRDVAEDIGMHESTVSRVTSNKYAHTPQGIYELKYFFSTAVSTTNGDTVAAESIKNRIRQLIQNEDPAKPLSDNKISQLLAEEGIKVARRTVAKYRDQLKILPVKHRRKARTG
ncbi:RNA polymerase sigma-54 factor [Desulfolithobacter dissulfuricans]|uniref:RNA polymerase sigma-54 factor n=1 Tax=Desulfolithobacter dissulfuricans TaxID=2795293 RepID=A0A915XLH6_9BACT|nr:RNA polymerase factor sigma-54 [Desulfolithobacter dissulfuricans]BCO10798.1 RNA polymerase sigma-54 factor [Desulfolithobacter dissulfuricans]